MTSPTEAVSPEERILSQYNALLGIAETEFPPERFAKVKQLFTDFQDRMLLAPASPVEHYHSAYAGGYLDHIHNVLKSAMKVAGVLKAMGGEIDFTKEELVFACMFHDLGKLGDLHVPYYIPNDSDWHVKNRGELFKLHPDLQYMKVTERALWLLQHYGIQMSQKEWLAIKLSDGVYDESNKSYFINYQRLPMHTNLHHVVHWGDHIATVGERDDWRHANEEWHLPTVMKRDDDQA